MNEPGASRRSRYGFPLRLRSLAWAVAAVAGLGLMSGAAAPVMAGDAQAGAQAFIVCGACHAVTPDGAALIGPNLFGVVGRAVASVPGFDYSPELKATGGQWTAERIDQFLTDPNAFAPGTRMGFVGVADPVERANGAAPAQDFGPDWPAGPGQAETGALCNSCHSLAIVKQQQLSRETWDKLLVWMVEEQGMAEQPSERRTLILDYLATHFGAP